MIILNDMIFVAEMYFEHSLTIPVSYAVATSHNSIFYSSDFTRLYDFATFRK